MDGVIYHFISLLQMNLVIYLGLNHSCLLSISLFRVCRFHNTVTYTTKKYSLYIGCQCLPSIARTLTFYFLRVSNDAQDSFSNTHGIANRFSQIPPSRPTYDNMLLGSSKLFINRRAKLLFSCAPSNTITGIPTLSPALLVSCCNVCAIN